MCSRLRAPWDAASLRARGRSFARSFTLPEGTDLERIDAELANGVLRIQIPRHADAQPRKIKLSKPVGRLVEKVKGMLKTGEEKEERQEVRT